MSVLLYPLAALAIVLVASVVMWFRSRQPTSIESGVEAFSREMRALSPDGDPDVQRRAERETGLLSVLRGGPFRDR